MRIIKCITVVSLVVLSWHCSAQKNVYTVTEKYNANIFIDFIKYVNNCITDKADITDSTHLKYILSHYLFLNKKLVPNEELLSLNELSNEQLKPVKEELQSFFNYLQGKENESFGKNLMAIPMRLSSDSFIYNRLTTFQKENTFAFYDKRRPEQTLGYILFLPPIKNKSNSPKIWSWTLMYKFGKFFFRSVTGEEGYEYMFTPDERPVRRIEHL